MRYPKLILKSGRDRTVRAGHPWIFSGAIDAAKSEPAEAGVVDVFAAEGPFLIRGLYSPKSQISVRALTADADESVDAGFFASRLRQAAALRSWLFDGSGTDACRLVHGEADFLPGLVIDRYADVCAVQISNAGMETFRDEIVAALCEIVKPSGIYERSDIGVRREEGLDERTGLLFGEVPDRVVIAEHGAKYEVDVRAGQKTGFFLDQKENRARLAAFAKGKRVLNCFSYTGGFSVAAGLAGAASVASVDASHAALEIAERNLELNDLDPSVHELVQADVFEYLEGLKNEKRQFDVIVLDPPAFAKSKKDLVSGLKAYTRLNEQALKLLAPGGILATFSCSHHVDLMAFSNMLHIAAGRAGRRVQILETRFASPDHPVSVHFPEGQYLKGYIARVL